MWRCLPLVLVALLAGAGSSAFAQTTRLDSMAQAVAELRAELEELRETVMVLDVPVVEDVGSPMPAEPLLEDVLLPDDEPLLLPEMEEMEEPNSGMKTIGVLVVVLALILIPFLIGVAWAGRRGGGAAADRRGPLGYVFLILGILALWVAVGDNLSLMIDPPSIVIVVLGSAFFTLAHLRLGDIRDAIRITAGNLPAADGAGKRALVVFRTMESFLIATGVLGYLIGLVIMLAHMDDPAKIGPGMAIALLTLIYAVGVAKLVVAPMSLRVQYRMETTDESQRLPGGGPALVAGIAIAGMLPFLLLLLSFN